MPTKAMPVKEAAQIALRIAEDMQVELIDVELVKEPTGRFLRFYIDKEAAISLSELEAFHRRIQPLVERVDYDYMEVSSPGADRPLKNQRDFDRAMGLLVEAKTYKPINGQKNFVGELTGYEDGKITIAAQTGEITLAQKYVALIRPKIEVDEEELMRTLPDEEPQNKK